MHPSWIFRLGVCKSLVNHGRIQKANSTRIYSTYCEGLQAPARNSGPATYMQDGAASWLTRLREELIEKARHNSRREGNYESSMRVREAWRTLYERNGFRQPFLPPFRLTVCAICLASTYSRLCGRLVGVILLGPAGCWRTITIGAESLQSNNTHVSNQSRFHLGYLAFSFLEMVILFFRALYLTLLFTPAVLMTPFVSINGGWSREVWLHLVRISLELAGAAFIKWGQWAATRPDLFPRDLCQELTKLHTMAPAHTFSHTQKTVEKAFGRKLFEIFESFEEEPVASGSIAQVHRASLRFHFPGKKSKSMLVAVKVRHPRVSDIIRRDFIIINWIASLTSFMPGLRWLKLDESVQQFAVFMLTQVDLAREAAHLNRFIYNFRRWKDVSFPKPLYPLVHPAVLVETYEQGENVSRFMEHAENTRINSVLAHIGTHTLLKMLLVDNFIHADMHPGNILIRIKQRKPFAKRLFQSRPHIVLLDVGMTAELAKKDRENLLQLFKAIAQRDGHKAAECALSFSKNQSCPQPDRFIKEMESLFKFWGTKEGDAIHPADCMQELLDQIRKHKVNISGDVCTVLVTSLVLQGWQRKLDPEYDIMATLQTMLFKVDWAKSLSYTIDQIMAP